MKKFYIIIISLVLLILSVNIFYYFDNYKKQIGFQRELLSSETEVCASKIEKTGNNFENEINYILFTDEVVGIFNPENNNSTAIQKLQMFYYKYEDLVNNIYIYDTSSHVFSIYKDNKNKFINDLYISQNQVVLNSKDIFEKKGSKYYYSLPVFSAKNVLIANLVVDIDIKNYVVSEFQNYKLDDNLWQWLIKDSSIVYDNSEVSWYNKLDEILTNIDGDFSGFIQHQAGTDSENWNILTSYHPIEFMGIKYGIAFSLKTQVLFSSLIKETIVISILSLILLAIAIFLIYKEFSEKQSLDETEIVVPTEDILTQVLEALPVGLILTDKSLEIKNLNKSAKNLLLVDDDKELIGSKISDIKLLESKYSKTKSSNDVFDENQFISYEKNGLQTVVANRELPIKLNNEEFIINILIDITSIEKSRKQEAEANTAKSEFLAKMSHEIRTPMNGIIGMIDVLNKSEMPDSQKEQLAIISKSANLLMALINDILDFSKIESGKMNLEEIPFKLSEEIKFAMDLFRPLAERKHIMLTSNIDPNIPDDIIGDPYRLRQVISNLVSNAVKFTNEGEIRISVKLEEDYNDNISLQFSIEDTGIGIPKKDIDKIFGSYVQADGSVSRRYGGTGLGTTISKQLVNLMNGEIWVESPSNISTDSKYPGSNFSFTIEAYADRIIEKEISFKDNVDPKDIKLLVINERKIGNSFFKPLEKAGFQITNVEYKTSLLEELKFNKDAKGKFHFIFIMDLVDSSGFEVAQSIFDAKISSNYIVCMLSRNDKHGNYVQSKLLGVDQYFIEPFEINDIFRLLKKYVKNINLEINETDEVRKDLQILVADDNIINQKVAEMIFGNLGFKIDIANNGKEALDLTKDKDYDIVFTDLMMPEMDGWQVVKELRNAGFERPVIAMTATASNEVKRKAFKAGMNDYLVKPVEIKTIKNLLHKFFTS